MKALILAGGQGLRLRPLTEDRPKPLVEVAGRPIAEFQLDWLKESGLVDHVTFLTGYQAEKLKSHFKDEYKGIKIDYSVEEAPLGTGGAIKKAVEPWGSANEDFVVMNGDIVTKMNLGDMVSAHTTPATKTAATMLLVPYRSRFGTVQIDKLRMVRKFEEKPVFPDVWINGGIYVMNLQKITKHLPEKGDVEKETFPKLVPYAEIAAFPFYGFWSLIDSIKDLQEVEAQLKVAAQG